MSSNISKKLLKTIFKANAGCGCGKPKLSDVIEPTPKLTVPINKTLDRPDSSSSSSCLGRNDGVSTTDDTVELSSSSASHSEGVNEIIGDHLDYQPQKNCLQEKKKNKIITSKKSLTDSYIAVVKESDDPFEDFKQSMKQMIVEKEIYAKKDLQELLRCFLEMNTPSHHEIIVRAFTEIWNDVVSERLVVSTDHDGHLMKKTGADKCLDCCARAKAM